MRESKELGRLRRRRDKIRDGLLATYEIMRIAQRKLRQTERRIARLEADHD